MSLWSQAARSRYHTSPASNNAILWAVGMIVRVADPLGMGAGCRVTGKTEKNDKNHPPSLFDAHGHTTQMLHCVSDRCTIQGFERITDGSYRFMVSSESGF